MTGGPPETIPLRLDGYTDLPPGKIANVVTFLEMTAPPPTRPEPPPDDLVVRHVPDPDPAWFRALCRRIGENWLWTFLPLMPEDELVALLRNPAIEILVLEQNGEAIGVAELDRRQPGEVEIVLFGVAPEAIGTGAAHRLMNGVLARAFRPGTGRVWLHTCTHDHPAAVPFYLRAGFKPYKFAIEVSDDPRLTGDYPESAAPHVAVIRPK